MQSLTVFNICRVRGKVVDDHVCSCFDLMLLIKTNIILPREELVLMLSKLSSIIFKLSQLFLRFSLFIAKENPRIRLGQEEFLLAVVSNDGWKISQLILEDKAVVLKEVMWLIVIETSTHDLLRHPFLKHWVPFIVARHEALNHVMILERHKLPKVIVKWLDILCINLVFETTAQFGYISLLQRFLLGGFLLASIFIVVIFFIEVVVIIVIIVVRACIGSLSVIETHFMLF